MMAEFSRFMAVLGLNQGSTDGHVHRGRSADSLNSNPWIEPNFEMKFDEYNDILPK